MHTQHGAYCFGAAVPQRLGPPLARSVRVHIHARLQARHGRVSRTEALLVPSRLKTQTLPSSDPSTSSSEAGPSPQSTAESWSLASLRCWQSVFPAGALLSFAGLTLATFNMFGYNMEAPGSVLEAMGVLAAIITVHECGHFLAARLQGIHVNKFSIGFGPPLLTIQVTKVG